MVTKEELHRLVDALSEGELRRIEQLLNTSSLPDRLDLPTLIAQQGFRPLTDPLALAEGIWPEDESVDDFLAARETWRREDEDA
jgi:hypothetical protein